MPEIWQKIKLGQLVQVIHGFAFKGEFITSEARTHFLVTPGNFKIGGGFNYSLKKFYSGPLDESYVLSSGDLVVTMTDLSKAGDTLGYPALIPEIPGHVALHNQRIGRVRVLEPKSLDLRFLYFALCCDEYRKEVLASATGTSVRHTSPKRIYEYSIPLPTLPEQRAIAGILGALDDKIDLNRRMNETLEAMARALFKSWFVDFDPVRAKMEGRQPFGMDQATADLFPDRLAESEIGLIPEGWEVRCIKELASRIAMGPFGSRLKRDCFTDSGVPIIKGGNIANGFVDANFDFVSESKADELANSVAVPGDIVFTHRGTLGQVGMIPRSSSYERYVVSQSQMYLRPNATMVDGSWLHQWFLAVGMAELLTYTATTGVPAIGRPSTSLKNIRVLVPPRKVTGHYASMALPIEDRSWANNQQSRTLAELRDLLLPKLLSGEIRVADAEQEVEAVA